jgi:hypothetical protein
MSILIPSLTVTPNACAPGVPVSASVYTSLPATAITLQGITTINPASVEYTIIALFAPSAIDFFSTLLGQACATVTAYQYSTVGPLSILQSLEAAIPPTSALTSPTTTPAPAISTTSSKTSTAPTAHPSKTITNGAAAGLAVGCLFAGALLALLGVFVFFKRHRAFTPARTHGDDPAGETVVKRRPVTEHTDPPMRPVGLDNGPVREKSVGVGVGAGDIDDMPEARVRK